MANATMVRVGLANPPVGNVDEPAMKRLLIPCTLLFSSTTPDRGEEDILVVPM
jgi:hypothetical protein